MSKPNAGRARKAQPKPPRPTEGGSFIRDPKTGDLTKVSPDPQPDTLAPTDGNDADKLES